ncbi:MAG: pentapeptide repeat-containing protein [Gammaproteobacteria bacterium]|nr:pentapeptide repeat-containing protein [Gammaproteobacteria bacterium]
MSELWYVRCGDSIRGPFKEAIVAQFVLGRHITAADRLSRDRENWVSVAEIYPDAAVSEPAPTSGRGMSSDAPPSSPERPGLFRQGFSVAMLCAAVIAISLGIGHESTQAETDCGAAPRPNINFDHCRLTHRSFDDADLRTASLRSALLTGTSFLGARLGGADLAFAQLRDSDFSHADMGAVRAVGADLKGADLRHTDLRHADLSHADLRGANMSGADISEARFDHARWNDEQKCLPGSIGGCALPERQNSGS